MTTSARKLLIELGKSLPFVICFIVAVSFIETAIAVAFGNYMAYNGVLIPNTPISFYIASYFRYDWTLVIVLSILSVAIRTCIWNKLCVLYLALQIFERQYFTFELYEKDILLTSTVNLIVCGYLIYKGVLK